MATAYEVVREEEATKAKLHRCESKKAAPELSYPEPRNIMSSKPPVPQPTCE